MSVSPLKYDILYFMSLYQYQWFLNRKIDEY